MVDMEPFNRSACGILQNTCQKAVSFLSRVLTGFAALSLISAGAAWLIRATLLHSTKIRTRNALTHKLLYSIDN